MITQYFDLNMIPDSEPVVVHVNQYDTGTGRLVATLYNGDTLYTPTGTAAIQGTKPDGIGFMYSATLSGNTVTADLKDQMSVVAGHVRCQIVVTETSGMTGTFCFDLEVQPSALPDDTSISESDYPIIEEMIRDAQEAAADATIAKADAENAASDSEAWAVGTRGGDPVGPSDPTYQNNSKYYAEHGGGGSGGHVIMDESGNDMPARGTLQFLNMEVTDDPTHLKTVVSGSKGLLPYLYIDSEAGATVTVTAPDSSTITPTAAGSGHWECELEGYGVYVIHSILNGEDAVYSLTVDTVKEYHITDSHYDFTINVTADLGSTIRVEAGSEMYTETGTGSSQAIIVHQASTQYTITETLDGYTDTETVTSAATTGQSTSVTLHVFTATLSLSSSSDELAGATITITKGGTTIGTTEFSASSPYTASFPVHETGTFTCTCTYQGTDYSGEAVVSAETSYPVQIDTLPDGSTVEPTNSIQIWLACAGIDKSYTMLSEVLADHDTLYLLMGSDNAVDYLVRSTTWASGITADEYGMKYIGKWNYASDTLLNDSTWGQAICDSAYFESVLNAKVPKLTSSTSQNVSSISDLQNYPAYQAFDRDTTTAWIANNGQSSAGQTSNEGWIGYQFTEPIKCMFAEFTGRSDLPVQEYSFKASNDGTTFTEVLASGTTLSSQTGVRIPFTNNSEYAYYRMYLKQKNSSSGSLVIPRASELQFYGRQDVTENLIDIYSAADDEVHITINGQDQVLCHTDLTGHYAVDRQDLPNGTYTITSTVADDPTNLSNKYSKSVTITDGTSEIHVMPDNCLYWYGYINGLEIVNSTNGWAHVSSSYTGWTNPTFNLNNIYISGGAETKEAGVGTPNKHIFNTEYAIMSGSSIASGSCGFIGHNIAKQDGGNYAQLTTQNSKTLLSKAAVATGTEYYLSAYTMYHRSFYLYAFWYD